jgi:hypothetical protein
MQPSMTPTASATTASRGSTMALLGWAWALLSFIGWALAHLAVLLLLSTLFSQLSLPHGTMLGTAAALATVIAAAVALLAGRLAFGRRLVASPTAWIVLCLGALLAGGVQVALVDWATVRQGYFDPEMIGSTIFLFATLSGMTVAAFGALVAPRLARTAPMVAVVAGAVLSLFIIGSNVTGLAGGVSPESVPLAMALILAGVFAVTVAALAIRRALMT